MLVNDIVEDHSILSFESRDMGVSINNRTPHLIVSLTTVPYRFHQVHITIESIMRQTLKPDKILLWLSGELGNVNIPAPLKNQEKRGLFIMHARDLGPHTKLIPALKMFPSSVIITVDDDAFYHPSCIEKLYSEHLKDKKTIFGHMCGYMGGRIRDEGVVNFNDWFFQKKNPRYPNQLVPYGMAGTIYPPGCFGDDEIFREDIFRNICPYHDDVWFKAMSLRAGTASKNVTNCHPLTVNEHKHTFLLPNTQKKKLSDINVAVGNEQFKKVFEKYNLFGKLCEI